MSRLRNTIFYVLVSIIMSLLTINRMEATIGISDGRNNLTLLFGLVFILLLIVFFNREDDVSKELKTLSILFLLSSVPSLLFSSTNVDVLYGLISVIFVPLGIIIGKYFCKKWWVSDNTDLVLLLIMLPAVVGCVWIVVMSNTIGMFHLGRDYVFSVVIFLPLVYFIRSPYLKFGIFALILYVVILSAKRTALIVFCSSLIIYIYAGVRKFGAFKINIKALFSVLIISLSLIFVVQFFFLGSAKESLESTIERMSNMDDDSNKERENIYTKVINEIENSSISSIVFGHGYNGVSRDLFGHPAHNDYLEITYDYGLLSVFLYILIFISLLFSYRKNRIRLCDNPYIMIVFLTIVMMNGANCFITNPTYVYVCMFCIGWVLEFTRLKIIYDVKKLS